MTINLPDLRLFVVLLLLSLTFNCRAEVFPSEGAKLNYTQVMFEYNKVKGASFYAVQVAEIGADSSFKIVLIEQQDSSTATLIKNLRFGKKYQWRYAAIVNGQKTEWQGPYHFETLQQVEFKKNLLSLKVTINDSSNQGGLIVSDATHTIIDRYGKVVWFLPGVDWKFDLKDKDLGDKTRKLMEVKPIVLDLRLSPVGTITYIRDSSLTECDLTGKKLWEKQNTPPVSERGEELFNHVFFRAPDGHYWALGRQQWAKTPAGITTELLNKYPVRKTFGGTEYAQVEFGTILEYDKQGKTVWNWNSRNYLDSNPLAIRGTGPEYYLIKAHANALSVDAKNEFVYMGFRDISRVIKIEKRTGKVKDSWGEVWANGEGAQHALPVHMQHDGNILENGNIAVFNNDDYNDSSGTPSAIIFSQQPGHDGEVVWQYTFKLDSVRKPKSRTGGNVQQLPNGNYLVCTGNVNNILEITPDKRVVWQAHVTANNVWGYDADWRLYRAYYISSLYPCYFVFDMDRDTISTESPELNIRIFNKGSEKDSYVIRVYSEKGNLLRQFTTQVVPGNRSITFKIKPGLVAGYRELEVRINPIANPDFERRDKVVVR